MARLVEAAKAWSSGPGDRAGFERKAFASSPSPKNIMPIPVARLMAALKERAAAGDAAGALALAMRITQALQTRSFRQHAGDWDVHADADSEMPDLLPPGFGDTSDASAVFRNPDRHRRSLHQLVQPWCRVAQTAPSDATASSMSRSLPAVSRTRSVPRCSIPNLGAVIVNEGFAQHSRHDAPVLRSLMASMDQKETVRLRAGAGAGR